MISSDDLMTDDVVSRNNRGAIDSWMIQKVPSSVAINQNSETLALACWIDRLFRNYLMNFKIANA